MRIAILVNDKAIEWAWHAVLAIEKETGLKFSAKQGKTGFVCLVPDQDAATPGAALDVARKGRDCLAGFGEKFVRPLGEWREGEDPINLEDAWAALADAKVAEGDFSAQEESHPWSTGFAVDRS